MDDLDSFWIFQESNAVDELKQKLQYTTYELEFTRKEANEEIRKSNERIKKLGQLLQTICKERDEAKAQLKKFQQIMEFNNKQPNNVVNDFTIPTTAFPATPFSPDSPLLTTNYPTKTNSSITESSSFSLETHTNNTHVVDSLSSPDSSNVVNFSTPVVGKPATPPQLVDQESLIIANLAKNKQLPTKGKLLQAVMEAGPLLSTLMVAGSLPTWRNPPGVLTHQIPPVDLKGCVGSGSGRVPGLPVMGHVSSSNGSVGAGLGLSSGRVPGLDVMGHVSNSNGSVGAGLGLGLGSGRVPGMDVMGHVSTSNGSVGICQKSMLDFGNGSCFMGGRMMINSGVDFDCQILKRQRII